MKFLPKSAALAATAAMLAMSLTACGQATGDTAAAAKTAAGFPVKFDNCGTKVKVDQAPKRVVTIKSTSTELLLALGLGDRIVGSAFADGPLPKQWTKDAAGIKVISDKAPSKEAVLKLEPDFILAGWESNLAADTAGERDRLAKLGVQTYVSPAACQEKAYQPKKLNFDHMFVSFEQVGQIFDHADRADALIAKQKQALKDVAKAKTGTSALWFSSGTDLPFVGGGIGAPQMVLEALGLDNIAADVQDTWTSLSWEKIADADPDVIVLVDATWNSAAKKIDHLKSHPVTAELKAVKAGNFLIVPFPASEAGVRTVPATVDMGAQLKKLGLAN